MNVENGYKAERCTISSISGLCVNMHYFNVQRKLKHIFTSCQALLTIFLMPVAPPDFHQWSSLRGKLEVKTMLSFLINNKIKHLNAKGMIKSRGKQIRV